MVRLATLALMVVLCAARADACTFCGENIRSRPTLRMQYSQAKVVFIGQLKNPRIDPNTDEAYTDLHATKVMKEHQDRGMQNTVVIRAYLPVVGDAPKEYIAFCGITDGKLNYASGIPYSAAIVEYLQAAAKLNPDDAAARLAFYFQHLASPDVVVAADAFVEFARTPDAEIEKAAKHYDPALLRKLIANEQTPDERIGVFAYLLGISGRAEDADFLARMLKQAPLTERVRDSFGGLLAGYILLAPKDGWAFAARILGDTEQSFSVKLSSIQTVRFFQASQRDACKSEILKCCAVLLPQGDLADQAIEDMRRWGYWDLSREVFEQFGKSSHSAPIVKRAIVRYALTCPGEDAKKFLARVQESDPKLVETVQAHLNLFKPAKP